MSRKGKSIPTESRLVLAYGYGYSRTTLINLLKITKLYT